MAIILKEYIGSVAASNGVKKHNGNIDLKEGLLKGISPIKKNSLMQYIEGIHEGPTGNGNWYTKEALKKSVKSWLLPYNKPLIMHHNEENGKAIGRIIDCDYTEIGTRSGTPALTFLCNIPDKDGIEQIEDGRLLTTSVGVTATDVTCSICGEQIESVDEEGNSYCGHVKGEIYNNKVCFWMVHDMIAKELSYVIVPSDKYACNLNSWRVGEEKDLKLAEKIKDKINELNLKEGACMDKTVKNDKDLKEGLLLDEEIVKASIATNVDEDIQKEKEGDDNNGVQDNKEKEDNKEEEVVVEENTEDKAKEEDEEESEEETIEEKMAKLERSLEEYAELLKAATDDAMNNKKLLTLAQEKIDELSATAKEKEAEVMRAEDEIVMVKADLREYMENNIITLKEMAGETIDEGFKNSLAIETTENLKSTAVSLSESLKSKKTVKESKIKITECQDPTLKDTSKDLKKKENNIVNKEIKESNVSLEEALSSLYKM